MARLTLLLPPRSRFAGIAMPVGLAKTMGRADYLAQEGGTQAQLARHFQLLPNRWSVAALTRVADSDENDARLSGWLRADPAHLRPDINGARLLGIGAALGIDQTDVEAFLPALRPLFGDAGFTLDAPHAARWYLRLPREAKLPAFASPDDALGDDLFEHRLDGPEARRWRSLESEAQVTLHNHPRNAERLAAGRPAINALWFWGGGVLPDSVSSESPTLYSEDALLHGIATLAKLGAMPLSNATPELENALIDLRSQRDARAIVNAWLVPAATTLRRDLVLDFVDGSVYTLRASQRWRWWRSALARLSE